MLNNMVKGVSLFNIPTNFKDYSTIPIDGYYKLYGNINNMKDCSGIGYINPKLVKFNNIINKHKVILSESYGSYYNVLNAPIYISPNSICTNTYIVIGNYDTKLECMNLISYINTKLFRYLVSLRKRTQHNPRSVFKFVPLLDMNKSWTDNELYQLFGLTDKEISIIEGAINEI